jgi:hypothetical protein
MMKRCFCSSFHSQEENERKGRKSKQTQKLNAESGGNEHCKSTIAVVIFQSLALQLGKEKHKNVARF